MQRLQIYDELSFYLSNRFIVLSCSSCCWHRHLRNFTQQFQNTHQTPSSSSHSVPEQYTMADRSLPVLKSVTNQSYRSHNTSTKQQSFHSRHQKPCNDDEEDYYESYIQ